ncbi:LytR C-terminal domain-containing protein [Dermabacteraceae bacterium TAE3-ERU27]|nr:LytR C-terminal domain-containing protein [Dermabacteraceae bacterium TAE3-ERU27]
MADNDYPYPPDRFDEEAQHSTHFGAHREEEPFWRRNLLALIIAAVAFVIIALLFAYSLSLCGGEGKAAPKEKAGQSAPAKAGADAKQDGAKSNANADDAKKTKASNSDEEEGDTPAPKGSEQEKEAKAKAEEKAKQDSNQAANGGVDKNLKVAVLNATTVNGRAAKWRDKFSGEGWKNVEASNAQGASKENVVFYRDEKDRATAEALAKAAGLSGATQSNKYPAPITLIVVTRAN